MKELLMDTLIGLIVVATPIVVWFLMTFIVGWLSG